MAARNSVDRGKSLFNFRTAICLFVVILLCLGAASAQTRKKRKQQGIFPNPVSGAKKAFKNNRVRKIVNITSAYGAKSNVVVRKIVVPPPTPAPKLTVRAVAKQQNPIAPALVNNSVSADPLLQPVGEFVSKINRDGYVPKQDFVVRSINDDASWVDSLELAQNKDYMVVALCDANCPMINLEILDAAGKTVVTHKARQPRLAIYFSPRQNGNFRFKTTVVACRQEPCRAAVGVYER